VRAGDLISFNHRRSCFSVWHLYGKGLLHWLRTMNPAFQLCHLVNQFVGGVSRNPRKFCRKTLRARFPVISARRHCFSHSFYLVWTAFFDPWSLVTENTCFPTCNCQLAGPLDPKAFDINEGRERLAWPNTPRCPGQKFSPLLTVPPVWTNSAGLDKFRRFGQIPPVWTNSAGLDKFRRFGRTTQSCRQIK